MPEPVAPSPDPLVQPYLESSRSAKPFWPGRRERGASSSCCSSSCSSRANAASSSASDAGMSSGGGGSVYRTGARDMVAELGWKVSKGRDGGGGMFCPGGGWSAFWERRMYASSPVGSFGTGAGSSVGGGGGGV